MSAVRKVFYDTEFIEDGKVIDLISIGMCDSRGREFYGVSLEFDPSKASPWVRENVIPKLPWDRYSDPAGPWMTRRKLALRVLDFLVPPMGIADPPCELWAYFAAYDHVALAQLFGRMINLPAGVPMFTHELMTLWNLCGQPEKPPKPADEHDALVDARWDRELYSVCIDHLAEQRERLSR